MSPKSILVICAVTIFLLQGCKPILTKPSPKNGILDVSAWDFQKNGVLNLDGEWEFYWKHLYDPSDLKGDKLIRSTGYITIPSDWNGQRIGDAVLTGEGFATYRLRIRGYRDKIMGIRVPDAYSAYVLWVNGELIAANGVVGTREDNEVPELVPVIRNFKSREENEIVLQVSNFFQHKGGANSSYTIGTTEDIIRDRELAVILNMFIIGMLVILFIYHICIFVLSRTDYLALWFGILCLFIAFRCLVTNDKFISVIFNGFSSNIAARIEYGSVFCGAAIFSIFIYWLFPKEFTKAAVRFLYGFALAEFIGTAVLPVKVFTSFLAFYQATTFIILLYCLFVIIRATINKRKLAFSMLMVVCSVILVTINDILYARLIVNTFFAASYDVPVLLVVQAYFVAYRIGSALNSVEKLSVELNDANIHLEQKVIERTQELEIEKKKTDDLLLNILPEATAQELKSKGRSEARTYSMVSVMFIDMVGFSELSKSIDTKLLVKEIHHCFSAFDDIIDKHRVEKIKTIGDAYLCVGGLPVPNITHSEDVLLAAYEIMDFMDQRAEQQKHTGGIALAIRVGVNTGPLVAGIVGTKKFAYDIWGDTVNTAARMEQNSEPGKINISGKTYELVKNKFSCTYRGKIDAKNKGMIDMYYVEQG